MVIHEKTITKFWKKVRKAGDDECWEWTGALLNSGYGLFNSGLPNDGKVITAHRLSYILTTGDIPKGYSVCHTCDNRKCCNPKHLWLGTTADNVRDRVTKGRGAAGERQGLAKLTDADVAAIRGIYASQYEYGIQTKLAEQYGVSVSTINSIIHRATWKHVSF